MGKKISILILLFIVSTSIAVKAQPYLDNLNKQANDMLVAFQKGDYNTLLRYTHPKIIEDFGGQKKALKTIKIAIETLRNQKVQIKKVILGKPTQIITDEKTIQCVMPQNMEMQIDETIAKSTVYIFGISYNGGNTWYFVNADSEKEESLRTKIPEMNKHIVIPKSEVIYN
ncbi:hypothetical protein [Pedobacter endophyticus]|uniref:DUF4252 domain-containing protein n=1 Tax=Pedobacter endophyticus TaxID=2789740 RepID=A0A7S9Q0G8_9SPHI|nr:hypothetical protein [Pedobacter endophyticus]QPH41598.1 hypothetical protein IZT61_10230 [Pedobacter endophyticus]